MVVRGGGAEIDSTDALLLQPHSRRVCIKVVVVNEGASLDDRTGSRTPQQHVVRRVVGGEQVLEPSDFVRFVKRWMQRHRFSARVFGAIAVSMVLLDHLVERICRLN